MKQFKDLPKFADVKADLFPLLTMEDYERHSSFISKKEYNSYFKLTMKSDKDIFGNYIRLDGAHTWADTYEMVFANPYIYNPLATINITIP